MANAIAGEGSSGGPRSLATAAADLAAVIDEVGADDGRSWVALVTDASFQASAGLVYATIGTSEVQVIAWSRPLVAGDKIIVKKFDNSANSPYVLEEFADLSASNAVPYGLDFPAPMTSPNGRFRAHWAGSILSIEVSTAGDATFGLTVGGTAVTVGDPIAAGSWVLVTATASSDADSAVEVTIG